MRNLCAAIPIFMMLLTGCLWSSCTNAGWQWKSDSEESEAAELLGVDSLLWAQADSMTQVLSPDERLGMLLMPSIYTQSDAATLKRIVEYATEMHVGGIILLKGDTLSAKIIADTLKAVGRGDIWIAIDAEWGLGMRLKDAPTYPLNHELGKDATPHQMYEYGHDVAAQARKLGINMILGPVVDVVPEDGKSFLARRSLGSDPAKVASLATAYSQGLEDGGMISVAKHFPGHGGVPSDSHRSLGVVYKSLYEMHECDLVPFQQYINAGLSGIMIGHLAFPAIDTLKVSAAVSESVITDLLRNDMGFGGLILTDALNMEGASGATAADAVLAGADLVLSPSNTAKALTNLKKAMAEGRLTQEMVDDHVRRILYYRLRK